MLALPLFDSMVPALSALQKTAGSRSTGLACLRAERDDHEDYLPTAVGSGLS